MQKSNICKKCLLVFQASTYYIRRRFCLIHFYCGQVKKNDSRSTKLCDCCSSPVISCLNRLSAQALSGKNKKDL